MKISNNLKQFNKIRLFRFWIIPNSKKQSKFTKIIWEQNNERQSPLNIIAYANNDSELARESNKQKTEKFKNL